MPERFVHQPRSSANNAIVWLDAADAIEAASGHTIQGESRRIVRKAADLLTPFVAPSVGAIVKSAAPGLSGTSELASEYRYAVAAVRSGASGESALAALTEHRKILRALAKGATVSRAKRELVVRFLDKLASEYQSAESGALESSSDPIRDYR